MTTTAIAAIERALVLDDIDAIRPLLMSALGSLKQQPGTIDDLGLHARLTHEIKKHDSMSAAARAWGVSKQTLYNALSGNIPVPPKILRAIGMRKVGQRRLYQEV